jgi:cytoskeleton protein RodZ
MGAFGERLRREREMRGISLNEIAESTKISRRHLESLENEDFDSLPGGVFNRGFVRAYARFVGINEEQAVADYNAVRTEPEMVPDQFPLEVHVKPDRELNPKRSPLPLILSVAALVAFIVVVWARSRSHQPEPAKAAAPAPSSASTTTGSDSSPKQVSTPPPVVTPVPAAVTPVPAAVTPAQAAATPVQAAPPPSVSPAAFKKAAAVKAVSTPTPTPDRTFLVVVRAKEDAWVSLVADGKTSWEGILRADRQRQVRAGRQVVLTTGNAGGLTVIYNGKVLRTLGSESEVRTLTFTRAGPVH